MPRISFFVILPVPISRPLYTCRESAEIISPLNFFASLTPKALLPLAVEPTMTNTFRLCVSIVPSSHLFPKQMMSHAPRAWWLETKSYARILRASSASFGRGSKNQKFSLPFFFSSAGGVGGADKKWKRNFWFCFAVSDYKISFFYFISYGA